MKRRATCLMAGVALSLVFLYLNSWGGSSCKDAPGLLLVKFKPGVLVDYGLKKAGTALTGIVSVDQLNQKYNAKGLRKVFPEETSPSAPGSNLLDLSGFYEIEFPEESNLSELTSAYSQDPNLESVETVAICPVDVVNNDPDNQYHLYNVRAYGAWDNETGDTSINLGILDTGVLWSHPDLSLNIWTNKGEIAGNGIDDDTNGYVDDVRGWDFVNGGYLCNSAGGEDCSTPDNDPKDFHGHGTHVAGISAAVTNNSTGGAGLAGGWFPAKKGCKIMALRIGWDATDGNGYVSMDNAASAINYARRKGVVAINCSWGSSSNSALQAAVTNALAQGIAFCKAYGNDNLENPYDYLVNTFPQVIAIAATNKWDQKAGFSNYGAYVDISAPGDQIRSTYAVNYAPTYATMGGTSMSAPMVTGMVGILRSKVPALTLTQVISLIKNYADNIDTLNPGYEGKLGAGRINIYNSLSHLPNAKFSADHVFGEAPFAVQFLDSSSGDGLYYWKWDFGDGDTASKSTSGFDTSHTYLNPGLYTCSYSVSGTWGTNTEGVLIGVTADTAGPNYSKGIPQQTGVKVPVYGNNSLTCSRLIIPMRYGHGSAPVRCDSVNFIGSRVESFPIKNVSVDNYNQTISLTLQNSSNPLPAGSGLLANLYFSIDSAAVVNDTIELDTAIIWGSYLDYTSTIFGDYVPHYRTGGVIIGTPLWGDASGDNKVNVSDVIFLINYLFKGGPQSNPPYIGDANCDHAITVADVVYLVSYLFKGGPPPGIGC
ncbi:MAG: S8 family serine peptidase [candidate division Zixibacteria bacterium]|nr:S8 family serine peptidase [candidate division Zixibacteria bacterium]